GPSRGRRVQRRGPDRRRAPLADRAPAGVPIPATRAAPAAPDRAPRLAREPSGVPLGAGDLPPAPGNVGRDRGLRVALRRRPRTRIPRSEPLYAVELAHSTVERAQWKVPGLARDFEDQAVGETQRRRLSIVLEGRRHHVRLLQRQVFVAEKHLERGRHLGWPY